MLAASAMGLAANGAELIGLTTNTMHIVADRITRDLGVPFIHIADPTVAALKADGVETVGLLGTRFTMEMPFYRDRLSAAGLEVLVPEVEITNLNGIIYDELCRGIVRDASREIYVRAIERLAARGAQAVILGCTEITLLIDDSSSPLPTYDTTDLHARALVEHALS
jgi:aspartate racemase